MRPPKPTFDAPSTSREVESDPYAELSSNLRHLALRLVREEASADDLVQEAWLASLDAKPGQVRDLNHWLRKVIVNIARRTYRRSRRRNDIERLAATPEARPQELPAETASTRAFLVEAVDRLREPYRSVMSLRFFDELEVNEIARRHDCSPATIRTQIRRGLDLLRESFDRSSGGKRGRWVRVLLPLALGADDRELPPQEVASSQASSSQLWLWLAGAVGVAAITSAVWFSRDTSDAPREPVPLASSKDSSEPPVPPLLARDSSGSRQSTSAPVTETVTELPEGVRRLEVMVLRQDGSPSVEGMVQLYGAQGARIMSPAREDGIWLADTDGRVEIPIPEELMEGEPWFSAEEPGVTLSVHERDQAWSPVHRVSVPRDGASLTVHCGGPAQDLELTLVDEGGGVLGDAIIILHGSRLDGYRGHDSAERSEVSTKHFSDAQGLVQMFFLPMREHQITICAPGKPRLEKVIQGEGRILAETIVVPDGFSIFGQVVMPDHSPAGGAHVWIEDSEVELLTTAKPGETYADEDGYFELQGARPGAQHLFATSAETRRLFASTILTVRADEEAVWEPILEDVVPLRVRLTDESGAPLPGALAMFLSDGPPDWAAARLANEEGISSIWMVPDGPLEVRGSLDTRAVGTTVLRGLQRQTEVIELRIADDPPVGTARGVLLDWSGLPPSRATVVLSSGRFQTYDVLADPQDGEFELVDVPPGPYWLAVRVLSQGQYVLGEVQVEAGETLELNEIRLPAPARVELDWECDPPSRDAPWKITAELPGLRRPLRVRTLIEQLNSIELIPGVYELGPIGEAESTVELEVEANGEPLPLKIHCR